MAELAREAVHEYVNRLEQAEQADEARLVEAGVGCLA